MRCGVMKTIISSPPPIPAHLQQRQQAVLDAFYNSLSDPTFQASTVFTNLFIPEPSLKVTRNYDGGPIIPKPGY